MYFGIQNIYVDLTSTTLSRWLTVHLSDSSSISQHLKKHSCPITVFREILTDNTTILEELNCKPRLQIFESLNIRNKSPDASKIKFETSTQFSLATVAICRIKFKKSYISINKTLYCTFAIYTPTGDGPK